MATNPLLVKKIKQLRKRGFALDKIVKATNLPRTTVYDHMKNVFISPELKQRIVAIGRKKVASISKRNKGKCWAGREVNLPQGWPSGLLFLTAHFIFDGVINYGNCVYQNRSPSLISGVECLMDKTFGLKSHKYFFENTGVYRIAYYNVELATYFREKASWLAANINNVSIPEKRIFLQAFFDDEGCAYWKKGKRIVRGFQKNLNMLDTVKELLWDFNISSTIDRKYKEIIISQKENLLSFQKEINFSSGIYINPNRKNSIWKKKLEKRYILSEMINSYKN